jgi:hypothetical protein
LILAGLAGRPRTITLKDASAMSPIRCNWS